MATNESYIASIDVGTTTMRCHIYNEKAELKGSATQKTRLHRPGQGMVEIVPDSLWEQFTSVVKDGIADAGLEAAQITAMGISTLRATFINWNRKTGVPYHNFICWNDTRAAAYIEQVNRSISFRSLELASRCVYFFSRLERFKAGGLFKFTSQHVSIKLSWMLENMKELKEDAMRGNVMFGMLDTWLLWKLTKGKIYASDLSNLCATGLFDLYKHDFNSIHMMYLGIPLSMMPGIRDTSGDWGVCDPELFGAAIPIRAVVGDQSSASFGQCCFKEGDIKVTMGTGTFLVLNTGRKPCMPSSGVYPAIGWKIGDEVVYQLECNDSDAGTVIDWCMKMGFFDQPGKSVEIATSVKNSGGVHFVPAFHGLQAPTNDFNACCCLIGLKTTTTPAHITRAALESLAYRVVQLYNVARRHSGTRLRPVLRFDGGVSNNDFILQLVSSLLIQKIDRPCNLDMSCLGAAFLAGLGAGVWKNKDELYRLRESQKVFQPESVVERYRPICREWMKAVQRSYMWYSS